MRPAVLTMPMRRVLTRTAIGVALAANAVLMVFAWQGLLSGSAPPDWLGLVDAANRVASGVDPYIGQTYGFRWSPVAAWLLVPVVAVGFQVWQLLHLAVLAVLPRRAVLLSLACFAFWVDLAMGNVVVFGFVLAYLALNGRSAGVLGFTAFALFVPRPLYIPLLLWLWLRNRDQRLPMVGIAVVIGLLTLATGYAWSWLEVLAKSSHDIVNASNMAPSKLIGYAWVPFGAVAAVWAFRRGRLGLASLLASPYWLPYYFQMVLLDFLPRRAEDEPEDSN